MSCGPGSQQRALSYINTGIAWWKRLPRFIQHSSGHIENSTTIPTEAGRGSTGAGSASPPSWSMWGPAAHGCWCCNDPVDTAYIKPSDQGNRRGRKVPVSTSGYQLPETAPAAPVWPSCSTREVSVMSSYWGLVSGARASPGEGIQIRLQYFCSCNQTHWNCKLQSKKSAVWATAHPGKGAAHKRGSRRAGMNPGYHQNGKGNSYLRSTEASQQVISRKQKKERSRTPLLQRIRRSVVWPAVFLHCLKEKDWAYGLHVGQVSQSYKTESKAKNLFHWQNN